MRESDPERKRLIERMFDAAMKEKFSQLARKYNSELVFKVWAELETARCNGVEPYCSKWGWNPEMTMMEALDCLDSYCDSIEAMIQDRQEEEKEQKES